MLDDDNTTSAEQVEPDETGNATAPVTDQTEAPETTESGEPTKAAKSTTKKTTARTGAKKTAKKTSAAKKSAQVSDPDPVEGKASDQAPASEKAGARTDGEPETAAKKPAVKRTAKKAASKKSPAKATAPEPPAADPAPSETAPDGDEAEKDENASSAEASPPPATMLLFQAPTVPEEPARRTRRRSEPEAEPEEDQPTADETVDDPGQSTEKPAAKQGKGSGSRGRNAKPKTAGSSGADQDDSSAATGDEDQTDSDNDTDGDQGGQRRRRRRGGRRRRKGDNNGTDGDGSKDDSDQDSDGDQQEGQGSSDDNDDSAGDGGGTRRRRRRRRAGEEGGDAGDDPENTVTRVRKGRTAEDQITAVTGSTRLEAKKQRRREGREAGRRRAPIVSEAEFLARRESVERTMVIRQRPDLTQIAVLEDKVLVEHYVARKSQTSLIGNVYVGRVQNVLPSMEAAFVDIGKGRNAVIYAGEVNWSALGHKDGQPRKIESVLSSGQSILVQVTKDPIGHKGARLTSQISLAGRFLVYVPDGTTSGISRKLPDTERSRLKALLKEIVPDTAGVIVRTAAEGASEEELTQDVERLKARWESIEAKSKSGGSPKLLYGEPDLTLKVVRDLFTEDFSKLVIQGKDAWKTVQEYVHDVAPDLEDRLERFEPGDNGHDAFTAYRIDEQIAKGLDRKVWLPSGGSLIIDRTEAMTVVDVNTGKFTGSGGNLEETVTKNNLEAAEEIVRQLRLRDIGGIIVVDFIDMVLENNRDLVLRRLVECLGRDRTRHQVAEVTSLGLVQMTRKRIGTGLLESFSEDCSHCQGRGVVVHDAPIEPKKQDDDRRGGRRRGRKSDNSDNSGGGNGGGSNRPTPPTPKDVAAVAKPENADRPPLDEVEAEATPPAESGRSQKSAKSEQPTKAEPSKKADPSEQAGATEPSERRKSGTETDQTDASREPAPETASAATPEEAPRVVTRSRTRRAASRSTGVGTSTPAVAITVNASESSQTPAPEADTPAPKVVTTTRDRRGASRSAASSADSAPDPAESTVTSDEASAPEAGAAAPEADLHVPIKKKGSRKR